MVQIQSSWFPLTDRNPQSFVEIPDAKPEDFKKATERVFHQKDAASGVEVPGFIGGKIICSLTVALTSHRQRFLVKLLR